MSRISIKIYYAILRSKITFSNKMNIIWIWKKKLLVEQAVNKTELMPNFLRHLQWKLRRIFVVFFSIKSWFFNQIKLVSFNVLTYFDNQISKTTNFQLILTTKMGSWMQNAPRKIGIILFTFPIILTLLNSLLPN